MCAAMISAQTKDKQLFYGNQQADGRINWTVAKPIVSNLRANNFTIVQQIPEFPNGQAAMFRFISQNINLETMIRLVLFSDGQTVGEF